MLAFMRRLASRLGALKASLVRSCFGVSLVVPPSKDLDAVLARCPHLVGDEAVYIPSPWLLSGHIHTLFCALQPPKSSPQLTYERHLIRLPDGGSLGLDFTLPLLEGDGQILVALHGLTGGSHEAYVRSLFHEMIHRKSSTGRWAAVCVNFRGCAGVSVTSERLYNAGQTDDLRCALLYIRSRFPRARLFGVGFSLGANSLVKYLGEEGSRGIPTPFVAAVSVGNPWDLLAGNGILEASRMGLLYSRAMASNLRRMLKRHQKVFQNSGILDWDQVYGNKKQTIQEFDELATRRIGGFSSVEEYYITQSSSRFFASVKTPTLALHASDDPIASVTVVPAAGAPGVPVVTAMTRFGGHLGWFEGLRPRRWVVKPAAEFLLASADVLADPALGELSLTVIKTDAGEMMVDPDKPELLGFELVAVGSVEGGVSSPESTLIRGL